MTNEPYGPYGRYTQIPQAQPADEQTPAAPNAAAAPNAPAAPNPQGDGLVSPVRTDIPQAAPAEEPDGAAPAKRKRGPRKGLIITAIVVGALLWTAAVAVFAVQVVKFADRMLQDHHASAEYGGSLPSFDDSDDYDIFGGFSAGSDDDVIPDYGDFSEYFSQNYSAAAGNNMETAETGTGVTVELQQPGASGEMLTYQEIYSTVSPAVVYLYTYVDDMPYGSGSGVIMSEDGYIITNTHIISVCDRCVVTLTDGTEYDAKLVGMDEASDVAVLKIDGEDLPYAVFGDSDAVQVGDEVVAIGNPISTVYNSTMTNGIISGINRTFVDDGYTMTLLQTNAAINEGNSGGALINMYGQVIGITNMKIMYNYYATVEGIGFAVPSAVIKEVADQLIENGFVYGEPAIGIIAAGLTSEAMSLYDLPSGVYISDIRDGSDALNRDIRVGDIITEVNGTPVSTVDEINTIKNQLQVGDTITLTIYRDGETFEEELTLVDSSAINYD